MTPARTPDVEHEPSGAGADAERLEKLLVLADRGGLFRSVALGASHAFANVLQALLHADAGAETSAISLERLGAGVRILSVLAREGEAVPSPTIVVDVLDEVDEWHRMQSGLAAIPVHLAVDSLLPAARARPTNLRHALLGIVTNAKEALNAAASGEIRIAASAAASGITIAVEDDGPGIPAADRIRVFEPFYTTKDPIFHPGLGLTVARHLIALDGGEVWVEASAKGSGTRVVVRLAAWASVGR